MRALVLAHIFGVPVEETLASLGGLGFVVAAAVASTMRRLRTKIARLMLNASLRSKSGSPST
jgi:hypothetical protein